MKNIKLIVAVVLCLAPLAANATPSTQIWIPSSGLSHFLFDVNQPQLSIASPPARLPSRSLT